MFKHVIYILSLGILLASCGVQKRLTSAAQKTNAARQTIQKDSTTLDSVMQKITQKSKKEMLDTVLTKQFAYTINTLQSNLEKIEQSVKATELLMQKKSNFNEKNYYASTKKYLDKIDSFQAQSRLRDRIYQLINDAITINAFKKFDMGTFFDPGAYKMPPTAIEKIAGSFQPAIDSIINLSNAYPDIKRTIYIVLVGYADAMSINTESSLYNELKFYISSDNPDKSQLNMTLSNLRAIELLRNMKMLMQNNAPKFTGYNALKLGYVSYGRGEALPFKNIINYRDDDERRRVVVFYWSILPDL